MRYYNIILTKADGTPYYFKSLGGLGLTSLYPDGAQNALWGFTNPAALNIELDLAIFNAADPDVNASYLRVWGLGLQDLGAAADLNGLNIAIYAGMARGLPLANPTQAGLLMQGTVFQALGNWIGTDQTVDMFFVPLGTSSGSSTAPANYAFNWPANSSLATAITSTLSAALGDKITPVVNIASSLVSNYAQVGYYQTLTQFASAMQEISQGILGGTYEGVTIATNGQRLSVFDSLMQAITPKAISVNDLIGQPTWLQPGVVSVKTVMRADIHVGDIISIPPTLFTKSPNAALQFSGNPSSQNLTFSGNFMVLQVHHYGNFRQASADAWNTTFQVTPLSNG